MNQTNTIDDSRQTLSQISQSHGRSIVDMLVEIQESRVPQNKSTSFLAPLECLELIDYPHENPPRDSISGEVIPPRCPDNSATEFRFLRRSYLNVLDLGKNNRKYTALSYTWRAPDGEDETSGRYWIEKKGQNSFEVSPVRNVVLDRITDFMRKSNIPNLWIDQHCIVQTTTCASSSCEHADCNEKRNAVHAMDLVYQLSEYPVALLSGYIMNGKDHLVLEAMVIKGVFKPPPMAPHISQQAWCVQTLRQTKGVVKLLHNMISDPWWHRAWPFQENALALSNMALLWRRESHSCFRIEPEFEEFKIKSQSFCEKATSFCLAVLYQIRTAGLQTEEYETMLMALEILETIKGSTKDTSRGSQLEGFIVASVERRAITECWDRLAIIGNCCRYGIRLEPLSLRDGEHSVSLSVLAMCLLNGEVLDNWKMKSAQDASQMTASQYLAAGLLNTRVKSISYDCHLAEVWLTTRGVHTKGHLWERGEVIWLEELTPHLACEILGDGRNPADITIKKLKRGEFAIICLYQCEKLITVLESLGYFTLSAQLKEFFERPEIQRVHFGKHQQDCGSPNLAYLWNTNFTMSLLFAFITQGWPMQVGRIWQPDAPEDKLSYSALFPGYHCADNEGLENYTAYPINPGQALVFTSTIEHVPNIIPHETKEDTGWSYLGAQRNPYRYTVMEVELDDSDNDQSGAPDEKQTPIPALRAKSWRSGLCFPGDTPPREIVFPWPRELLDVVPDKKNEDGGRSSE